MKLIKDLYNILPLFICHSSEMSIKLSVIYTLRSFSQPKHIAMPRCSVDIKTSSFRRAHNPIIPASHSVTFSRRRAAIRILFYDMHLHLAVAAKPARSIMVRRRSTHILPRFIS